MEDVGDRKVDSALFIQSGSLKLFALAQGDYNGNGCVDQADYTLWRDHNDQSPATFGEGDGNGDGVVNQDDFTIWQSNVGNSGNTNFRADFNRDGAVDFADYTVLSLHYGMPSCASRFEGDANGDGAVTFDDFSILYQDYGKTSCGCSCGTGAQSAMAGSDSSTGSLRSSLAASPDLNGDGALDENELAALDQLVLGTDLASYKNQQAMAVAAQPQPEMPDLPVPQPVAGLSEPVSEVAPTPTPVSR